MVAIEKFYKTEEFSVSDIHRQLKLTSGIIYVLLYDRP